MAGWKYVAWPLRFNDYLRRFWFSSPKLKKRIERAP